MKPARDDDDLSFGIGDRRRHRAFMRGTPIGRQHLGCVILSSQGTVSQHIAHKCRDVNLPMIDLVEMVP